MKPSVPFSLHVATISLGTTALSTNCLLLGINADWKGPTISPITSGKLLTNTFVIIK